MEELKARPTFHAIYMNFALQLAQRSTCSRLQVGCVITSPDFRKVIALGYNGGASGLHNECESLEPGQCGHLHAEENAVINCDVPRQTEKVVFCTHLPCTMCAKRLINVGGVKDVFFLNDYRIRDSVGLLTQAAIRVWRFQFPDAVQPAWKEGGF